VSGLTSRRASSTPLHLPELFADDPGPGQRLAVGPAGVFLDDAKNRAIDETMALLKPRAARRGAAQPDPLPCPRILRRRAPSATGTV
jgi:glucose-6-phosphate isomerase